MNRLHYECPALPRVSQLLCTKGTVLAPMERMKKLLFIIGATVVLASVAQAQNDPPRSFFLSQAGPVGGAYQVSYGGTVPHYTALWQNTTGQTIYVKHMHSWAGWAEQCHADTGYYLLIGNSVLDSYGWDHYADTGGANGNRDREFESGHLPEIPNGATVKLEFYAVGYNAANLPLLGLTFMDQNGNPRKADLGFPHAATFNVTCWIEYVTQP